MMFLGNLTIDLPLSHLCQKKQQLLSPSQLIISTGRAGPMCASCSSCVP